MTAYWELLKDPRWQKVRLKKLEAADWTCQSCYDSDNTLSVHHKRYVKGRSPWEYEEHELVVLCQPCHEAEHEMKDLRSELISRLEVDGPACADDFFSVAAGYISCQSRNEGLQNAAEAFFKTKPYTFIYGQFFGFLENAFPFTTSGLTFGATELQKDGSKLRADLLKVFKKHKMLRAEKSLDEKAGTKA